MDFPVINLMDFLHFTFSSHFTNNNNRELYDRKLTFYKICVCTSLKQMIERKIHFIHARKNYIQF